MLTCVLYRFFESATLAEWYIEEFDSVFFCIQMTHLEEFFEVFLGAGIE